MIDGISTTHPYRRVYDYMQFGRADEIPYRVLTYLMDLPGKDYTPPDDNDYPRTRLKKYLYWDDERPMAKALPTAEQIKSVWYNPAVPDMPPDSEKGYRIFPQSFVSQAQASGQTVLRCYIGNVTAKTSYNTRGYSASIALAFECMSSTALEANTRSTVLSRSFSMCCAITDALDGVNVDGVGSFYFDRYRNTYCGISPINDESSNVGYRLYMGLDWYGGHDISQ